MQTTHPDVFALENSDLEAILYAVVGKELNGSALTILSMTARLGCDPWAEAARWATLPRAGFIASLTTSIGLMPLVPSTLTDAMATAARLVQLLPVVTPGIRQGGMANAEVPSVPGWLLVTILYCAMACGMAISALVMPKPSQALAPRPSSRQRWPERSARHQLKPLMPDRSLGLWLARQAHKTSEPGCPHPPVHQDYDGIESSCCGGWTRDIRPGEGFLSEAGSPPVRVSADVTPDQPGRK